MPLPAWKRGGRRTSVWGGSGLAITKRRRTRSSPGSSPRPSTSTVAARARGSRRRISCRRSRTPGACRNFTEPNAVLRRPAGRRDLRRARTRDSARLGDAVHKRGEDTRERRRSRVRSTYYKAHGEAGLREQISTELRREPRVPRGLHRPEPAREAVSMSAVATVPPSPCRNAAQAAPRPRRLALPVPRAVPGRDAGVHALSAR